MLDVYKNTASKTLMRMKKSELMEFADQHNISVGLFMTKKEITELIFLQMNVKAEQYPVITPEEEIR
jgi:hypothetical protein